MSEQFRAATLRALYGAILLGAATFLAVLQVAEYRTAETIGDAGIAFGVTFVGYMIARGMAEGIIDSRRADAGNILPSDVTARPKAPEPVEVFEPVNPVR